MSRRKEWTYMYRDGELVRSSGDMSIMELVGEYLSTRPSNAGEINLDIFWLRDIPGSEDLEQEVVQEASVSVVVGQVLQGGA